MSPWQMFRVYHDYMTLIVRLLRSVTHVPSALSVAWKAFVAVNEQGGPPLVVCQRHPDYGHRRAGGYFFT